jgi:4-aminobutyrate aminotransferase-like enzyme
MTPEVAESVQALTLSTFGGNPVSMAQAYATVELHRAPPPVGERRDAGRRLRARLEALAARHAYVGDVRGMGLMQALEVVHPGTTDPTRSSRQRAGERRPRRGPAARQGRALGQRAADRAHAQRHADLIDEGCDRLDRAAARVG